MFENIFQKYITVKNIIFLIISILFIVFLSKINEVVILFFASYVIACSMEAPVKNLSKKFKRRTAAIIVILCSISLIFAFLVPVFMIGGYEIKELAVSFPQYTDSVKSYIMSLPFITKSTLTQIDLNGLLTSTSGITTKVIQESVNIGKNLGSGFIYFIISILLIYYFIVDRDVVRKTMLRLFPSQMRKRANEIMDSIAEKIGGYLIAQIVTMVSVGIIMTFGLIILRVEYAVILGLITAILDIVPVVGPAIALVICLIVCYKSGPGILALITLVFFIAQLTENNFVRPYVFGKFLNIHPIVIYFSIIIAAKYMGLLGVIFAPAIAATAVVLIEELYMKSIE